MKIQKTTNFNNMNFAAQKLDNNVRENWCKKAKNNPNKVIFLTQQEKQDEFVRIKAMVGNIMKNLFLKPDNAKYTYSENELTPLDYDLLDIFESGNRLYEEADYQKLSPKGLEIARRNTRFARRVAEKNLYYAKLLKENLDEKYGKNKYTFVCVGRSPSTIARCLEKMSVPVIYCPISGLRESELKEFIESSGYKKYLNFLQSSGLNTETIHKSNNKILVYDYTESGDSLNCFGKLLYKGLGLKKDRVILRSLNQDINDIAPDKYDAGLFIGDMFSCCNAERYGGVPELPWVWAGKIKNAKLTKQNQAGFNQFKFSLQDILKKHPQKN